MYRILIFVALTAGACVSLMYLAMLLRVFIGFFSEGTGIFASFIYAVTEPVLRPIRKFLDRFAFFEESPIDFSVIVAMLLFTVLSFFMPTVY